MTLNFSNSWTIVRGGKEIVITNVCSTLNCQAETAVHEFGHTFGMVHEQLHYDDYSSCLGADTDIVKSPDSVYGNFLVSATSFDFNSVMHYCRPRNMLSSVAFSQQDREGVARIFGSPGSTSTAIPVRSQIVTPNFGVPYTETLLDSSNVSHVVSKLRYEYTLRDPAFDFYIDDTRGFRPSKREIADVNGDKIADIIGFGKNRVYVSLGTRAGIFRSKFEAHSLFTFERGWREDTTDRFMGDVNGDGRSDIVGFGTSSVYVALARSNGTFGGYRNYKRYVPFIRLPI